ncbi:MAG: flavodoxin [Oscillospiraceae bacterium]|nr:flavodoxin [Oscillospiraceae bacterium]
MAIRALTVYYSWSENTEKIAQTIHSLVGGDILRLEPAEDYPTDYQACVNQAIPEVRGKQTPALKPFTLDIKQFDDVFIGSPIWCGSFAPPIRTFLRQYDLSGKTVHPFCTHGGGGQRNFTEDIRTTCYQSYVKDTLVLFGNGGANLQNAIAQWIIRTAQN